MKMTDTTIPDGVIITHVWSSFGHTFMGTDTVGEDSCLTCGGVWRLAWRGEEDPTGGDYEAANGDEPIECSALPDGAEHGYERACMRDECDPAEESCLHTSHDCNCLLCA